MHAISSASPSHVVIGPDRYDVLCWTVSDEGRPIAWFVVSGVLVAYNSQQQEAGHMRLLDGTAADGYDA